MIIVRLRGGLGNQLFQYAAGAALADFHNTSLKLDLYFYTKSSLLAKHTVRKPELDKFNIPVEIATKAEIHNFTGSNPVKRLLNKYSNYLHNPSVFAQPHYHFYEDFLNLPKPMYLSGYFQSEKYFLTAEGKIRKMYTPAVSLDSRNVETALTMKDSSSVGIHVRRGDYGTQSMYATASDEYYANAIKTIQEKVADPHFFVFSDDIAWCRANLKLGKVTYIDWNTGSDSYKDILMMANCKHNIIANSTFSWWGAWLNANSSKIVIAPKQWFKKQYSTLTNPVYPSRIYNPKDITPSSWIRL